jgi:hypothetical protein
VLEPGGFGGEGDVVRILSWFLIAAVMASVTPAAADSADRPPRGRALGIPFEGTPGPLNAITDVPGVEAGHVSLIRGEGLLKVGEDPVRTGVTMVLPRGRTSIKEVYGGFFNLTSTAGGVNTIERDTIVSTPQIPNAWTRFSRRPWKPPRRRSSTR